MRIGLALPQYGRFAAGNQVTGVAIAAERLGFDSLWASDRLLVAKEPRNLYPGLAGPSLVPEPYRKFLDPIGVLSAAAAVTTAPRLGTDVLVAPWYSAPLLARALSTLDNVSDGRLDIGLGIGWSIDEFEAVGVPLSGRGPRLDELLDVLDAMWSQDPAKHEGPLWTVPAAYPGALPVQRPRPPLLLAAFSPDGLRRIGRRANGWLPADLPVPLLQRMWSVVRDAAEQAGRDPDTLRIVLRTCPILSGPAKPDSVPGNTVHAVVDYLLSAAQAGVDEVAIDLQQTCASTSELLDTAAELLEPLRAG